MKRMRNIDTTVWICSSAIKAFHFYWINIIHRIKVYKTFIECKFNLQLVNPNLDMSFLTQMIFIHSTTTRSIQHSV